MNYVYFIKIVAVFIVLSSLFFSTLISNSVAWLIIFFILSISLIVQHVVYPRYRARYTNHLKSRYWKELKLSRLMLDNYKCYSCKTPVTFYTSDCHHKTYTNLGKESILDVITLCKECHNDVHNRH